MKRSQVATEDLARRCHVQRLAPTDAMAALDMARSIAHPWYRSQALAIVAHHQPSAEQKIELLLESLEAAQTQDDAGRIVSVAAEPLQALASLSSDLAQRCVRHLVTLADAETLALHRAESLLVLAESVKAFPRLLQLVVPSLARALELSQERGMVRIRQRAVSVLPKISRERSTSPGRKMSLTVGAMKGTRFVRTTL